jgi:hypothetical protein
MDKQACEKLKDVGMIFYRIAAIGRTDQSLPHKWVERPVRSSGIYELRLVGVLCAAGWER